MFVIKGVTGIQPLREVFRGIPRVFQECSGVFRECSGVFWPVPAFTDIRFSICFASYHRKILCARNVKIL